jgi:alkaline phosphatase D
MSRFLPLLALMHCCAAVPFAQAAALTGGPMPGHATGRTTSLWLQADGRAEAQIEYWLEQDPRKHELSTPTRLEEATDYSTRIELTGLRPDARYRYVVHLDGQPVLNGADLRLRTLPAGKWRGAAADFTVYLGSGAFLNDREWDRPGKPYGGGEGIYSTIAAAAAANPQPSLMLWLGDNLYFRDTDYDSPWAMNARYRASRSHPDLQALLRATRHYAVWGNHDYGPDNGNRSFEFKEASTDLFRRYWANPSYGQADVPGVFTRFGFLDADFFLLDDRSYRAGDDTVEPDNETSWWQEFKDWAIGSNQVTRMLGRRYLGNGPTWLGENKTLFGRAQIDWLKQSLIASSATFKIVVSGSQLFNDANTTEGWQNFKGEREPFVEWLNRQKIGGVLFLSGTRRHTELIRRERKNDYALYELACSPLTATADLPDKEKENPQRIPGSLFAQRNYCTLEIVGKPGERRLMVRVYDGKGRMLWEKKLAASDLNAPAPASQ